MKSALRSSLRMIILTGSGVVAVAQTMSVSSGTRTGVGEVFLPNGASISKAQMYVAGSSLQPVYHRPYSAEEVIEYSRTNGDSMHTPETALKAMLYRDSEGRTRTETMMAHGGKVEDVSPSFVEIIDSVGGSRYILDPRTKKARRSSWPLPAKDENRMTKVLPKTSMRPSGIAPEAISESLGAQDLEGLRAEVTLIMQTFPAGYVENKEPITTTAENWISPDLKIVLLAKTFDSRYGGTEVRLTNISQAEPDPSLFQVSADYLLVDH